MPHKGNAGPMSVKHAAHLLNPLRKFILSPSKLVSRLSLNPDASVLEVGPGPGYFSEEVARGVPNGRLTLVDIQQEMLNMAKKRLDEFGLTNIAYVQADAAVLPFEKEVFDVIFLVAVLGEIPDKKECIAELHRVLCPGGLLSITEQPGDPDYIRIDKMKKLVGEMFFLEQTFGSGRNYTANFRKQGGCV